MAHYHDPPVIGHVHGIYALDSILFMPEEQLAVCLINRSPTRVVGPPVSSAAAPSASRMCVHTVSQPSLSVPCNRVVTILRPVLWSCMMLATCSKFSQAAPPLSRPNPRRFLCELTHMSG
jgi:hypothetical protein